MSARTDLAKRITDIIGEDRAARLADEGLVIVDAVDLERFEASVIAAPDDADDTAPTDENEGT